VGVELLAVKHICIWCTSVHILQFALFMLVITGWNDTGWAAAQWGDDEPEPELAAASSPAGNGRETLGRSGARQKVAR
jgi:hypothetical protein